VKPADISVTKRGECLKDIINELATNSKKNIRDLYKEINEFKRDYRPRNKAVNYEHGILQVFRIL
jgi:hypothetical protein